MGTSSSSSGPGSGVPFDPPWLNPLDPNAGDPQDQIPDNESPQTEQPPNQVKDPSALPLELAPSGRFRNARYYLGKFASTGDEGSLKKALGNYSSRGMGGASRIAKRMRVSASVGADLFGFLQSVRDSSDNNVRNWVNLLISKDLSIYEVADEIISQVMPTGGSLEEESCKNSMAQAMSELYVINPDVELMSMNDDNIWTVLELFMSYEAYNRLVLDIGQIFESSKYSLIENVSRLYEIQQFLRSEMSVQIQKLRDNTPQPTKTEMNMLLQNAVQYTFEVFEEEI